MRSVSRRFYLAVFALLEATHSHAAASPKAGPAGHESCAIEPTAIVSDACASYSTLDSLNSALQPTIRNLTQNTDFFSYYRLNLYNKVCPFWSDESGLCGNKACAVETIVNEDDIPLIWRAEELGKLQGPKANHPDRELQQQQKPLKGELGDKVGESCVVEYDDECDERDYCVLEDESATGKGDYVSLIENPERFTGYSGPSANHVWEAIYRENCFSTPSDQPLTSQQPPSSPFSTDLAKDKAAYDLRHVLRSPQRSQGSPSTDQASFFGGHDPNLDEQCLEKRVFYRVISGMHTSISTHLCWDHLNQTTGTWGPNLECFKQRLHNNPDRISNLYFNYALVLRAVAKVRHAINNYTFCSGDLAQDQLTKERVLALANKIASGPKIYDESVMFQDNSLVGLKDDFRQRFRNVSRTMDCVGCDKCRLWGKLQTAGYGTALKILFEFDEQDSESNPPLRRTELVALINTLDKISHSLSAIGKFHDMIDAGYEAAPVTGFADDGLPMEEEHGSNPSTEPGSCSSSGPNVQQALNSEFALVLATLKWVLTEWLSIPRALMEIARVNLGRLWDLWLGIEKAPGDILGRWRYELTLSDPPIAPAAAGKHNEL